MFDPPCCLHTYILLPDNCCTHGFLNIRVDCEDSTDRFYTSRRLRGLQGQHGPFLPLLPPLRLRGRRGQHGPFLPPLGLPGQLHVLLSHPAAGEYLLCGFASPFDVEFRPSAHIGAGPRMPTVFRFSIPLKIKKKSSISYASKIILSVTPAQVYTDVAALLDGSAQTAVLPHEHLHHLHRVV